MVEIAFRVDASSEMGTGHFMRCLTLASWLRRCGATIRFVCRHLPEHLRGMLRNNGYELAMLLGNSTEAIADGPRHALWLGSSQQSDVQGTMGALAGRSWDWLVVDHYALDIRWEAPMRSLANRILVIDDLADRQHDCDVLLDQNLHTNMAMRYVGRVAPHCQLLLGPRYVLLREEFRRLRRHVKIRHGPVEGLLVVFGGVDSANYTGHVIRALDNLEIGNLHVDVVIGSEHPFRSQIVSDCQRRGFSCHLQTSKLAELMARADLAIGAGGFTSYEFIAMQLPAILLPVTEIQATVVTELSSKGVAYALFPRGEDVAAEVSVALQEALGSCSRHSSISLACRNFLDAEGAGRVATALLSDSYHRE